MDTLAKPQIICYSSTSVDYTINDVRWVPISARFVSLGGRSDGTGVAEVYSMTDGGVRREATFRAREHLKCGTFEAGDPGGRLLATGDFVGRLQTWDVESSPSRPTHEYEAAHGDVVNGIDGAEPEVVTGSRDGAVKVWDLRQKDKPVARFVPNTDTARRDCWTVAFGDHHGAEKCVAAGYDNGDLKLYDLRAMSVVHSANLDNGVVCVQFDRKDIPMNKLVATTLESKVFAFDMRTYHPTKHYARVVEKMVGGSATVWTARHLPQNRDVFMTTGGAGGLNLWRYEYPARRKERDADGVEYGVAGELQLLQRCSMSEQPITALDWCKEKLGLAVCSAFDQTLRVLLVTKLNLY